MDCENKLYLSKRNLLVLLSKLERLEAGESTQCAIIKYSNNLDPYNMVGMDECMVIAIPDQKYYVNRSAGAMHPQDEIGTLADCDAFAAKRNYHYTNTGDPIDFPKE
jgi:hypothetical protein